MQRAQMNSADKRRLSLEENAPNSQVKKPQLPSELRQALSKPQPVKQPPEIRLPIQQLGHHVLQSKSKIPSPVKVFHQNNLNKRPPYEENKRDDALPDTKVFKLDLPDEKETYAASGLKSSLHGTVYQLKLLMLFLKRGLTQYKRSFRLATEMDAAEKFDDVVFQYSKGSKLLYRALQAKHKQDETHKITANDLFTEKDDEFSLQKYFISYRRIQSNPEFKSGTWEDFTICTNIDFDFDDQTDSDYLYLKKLAKEDFYFERIVGRDDILNIGGQRYRFVSDQHKEKRNKIISKLKPIFEKTSDLSRLAKLLAEYVLIKKDKKGNSKTIGLSEELFKTYHGALAEEVIDIHDKKFRDHFLNAPVNLSPQAKLFLDAFREAAKACLESQEILSAQNKKILQTLSSESLSKIPKLSNAQPMDKENAFWQEIQKINLNVSDHFGKILKIESNPQLTDAKQLAEEIARLIDLSKRKSQVVVNIVRRKPIIVNNIDKLAGYVWVKKDEKIHFSTVFLNREQLLSDHLKDFRNNLKIVLIKKGVSFDTLDQYQFHIADFQTCKEQELQEHLNSKPTLPDDSVISDREIEDFLNKLVFAVNQPNEDKLGQIINEEIGQEFNLIDADLITNDFQKKMWDWLKEKQGSYLSENKAYAFFEEGREKIAKLVLIGPTSEYSKRIKTLGITFKEIPKKLRDFLTSEKEKQVFNLIAPQDNKLTAIKINQALQDLPSYQKEDSYIFIRLRSLLYLKNRVLEAFRSKMSNHLLIIECEAEENIHDLFKELSYILKKQSSKKIILITKQNDVLANEFKSHPQYIEKVDYSKFSDLTEASQNKLLKEKMVIFQGYEVSLGQLIDKDSRDIISPEALSNLVNKVDKMVIGSMLSSLGDVEHYYIDRAFNHRIRIKDDCFKAKDISDLFAISGVDENEISQLVNGKKIRWFGKTENKPVQFILLKDETAEENFKQLCRDYPGHTIHWLKKTGKGFIWQQSVGYLHWLRDYVEKDNTDLTEISDRLAVIADTPGMGKSTVLTHLAEQEKKSDTSLWVLRINLVDYVKQLDEMDFHNQDQAIDFLSRTEKLKTSLEKELFKYRFEQQGKTILFLDGFDEITPHYKEKVIQLLEILKSTSLEKIWVTTRPYMQNELEDKLQVFSYVLKPFSQKNQSGFLKEFWKKHLNLQAVNEQRLDIYTQELIELVTRSMFDKEKAFAGVPLQTRMLAEAFQEDFRKFYNSTEKSPQLPDKLDLLSLYQRFIKRKYEVYHGEKKKGDIKNPAVQESIDKELEGDENKYRALALRVLFPEWEHAKALIDGVNVGDPTLKRIGIIQIVDDQPRFIHRTFAEYFAADFLASQLEGNREDWKVRIFFLTDILIKSNYGIIRAFLNGQLTKKTLSGIVLKEYGKQIQELWSKEPDSLRNYGRTILHIAIVARNKKIISFLLESLKEYPDTLQALINAKDENDRTTLHEAAKYGDLDVVQWLIKNGADVNAKAKDGSTVLHEVALSDKWDVVQWLVKSKAVGGGGADVNEKNKSGNTVLYRAILSDKLDVVQWLVKPEAEGGGGADVNAKNEYGNTALHVAALYDKWDVVQWLVTPKAEGGGSADVNIKNQSGNTVLNRAVVNCCNLGILKYLVDNGANVNDTDEDDNTVLHWAAERGNLNIVQWLIKNGADVNAKARDGCTVLHYAIYSGNFDVVQWLVKPKAEDGGGADANDTIDEDGNTVLHYAAFSGNLDVVQILVKPKSEGGGGADVNTKAKDGSTVLHEAASSGNLELCRWLVEKNGADVNAKDNDDRAALHEAAKYGNLDVVQWLATPKAEGGGADIDVKTKDGSTVLHEAAKYDNWETCEWLVKEKAADVNVKDNGGRAVLHEAAKYGNLDVVQWLVTPKAEGGEGADVDVKTKDGSTVLHEAAKYGNSELCEWLVKEKGADVNAKDNGDRAVLHEAAKYGNLDVVQWLVIPKAEGGGSVDVNVKTKDDSTVLHEAARSGELELVKWKLEKNSEVHYITNQDGIRRIDYINHKSDEQNIVQLLIENGVNVEAADKYGGTALHYAVTLSKWDLVKYLIKAGADVNNLSFDKKTDLLNRQYAEDNDYERIIDLETSIEYIKSSQHR